MAKDDLRFMRRALRLAERGAGETNPNPLVGCVIVRRGRVVGEGWHARAGGPHAERVALARAGVRARGATLYVNLEPCSHLAKRTPPCAPALAEAGVRRVVVAMHDPNPAVSGRGLSLLRRAGIAVTNGVLAAEARRLNRRFAIAQVKQRPFVLLKAALSLDGRIATAAGESKWITTSGQRRAARALRRDHDGVLVGIGTVLADDPMLMPAPRTKRPFFRIVLDSRLRLPPGSRLARTARSAPVIALCAHDHASRRRALEAKGVVILLEPGSHGRVSPGWAMRALWRQGLRSVMVEGGSEVLGSFLVARLADEVALFRAPILLGGRESRGAFGGPGFRRLADALRLTGPDLAACELWTAGTRLTGRVKSVVK